MTIRVRQGVRERICDGCGDPTDAARIVKIGIPKDEVNPKGKGHIVLGDWCPSCQYDRQQHVDELMGTDYAASLAGAE